jgi:predicted RNase H-like nuclease (RuvC/YqgF family)
VQQREDNIEIKEKNVRLLKKEIKQLQDKNAELERDIEELPITGDTNTDNVIRRNRKLERELRDQKQDIHKLCEELREEYERSEGLIRNNFNNVKQLQDFSLAILSVDDKDIANNYNITMQKRNKAPLYKNSE